jgi:hypothetical protein
MSCGVIEDCLTCLDKGCVFGKHKEGHVECRLIEDFSGWVVEVARRRDQCRSHMSASSTIADSSTVADSTTVTEAAIFTDVTLPVEVPQQGHSTRLVVTIAVITGERLNLHESFMLLETNRMCQSGY